MGNTNKPELYFGIVAPLGVDYDPVVETLTSSLQEHEYKVEVIQVSDLINESAEHFRIFDEGHKNYQSTSFEEERVSRAMDKGNKICERFGKDDVLGKLSIAKIKEIRDRKKSNDEKFAYGTAFIIKSLKREGEVNVLRNIYRDSFFLISIFQSKDIRMMNLRKKIGNSHMEIDNSKFIEKAGDLLNRDHNDAHSNFGQRVGKIFHKADFFSAVDRTENKEVKRFVNLIFGAPFIVPKRDEFNMFMAHTVALRSCDLSRQVGAVITDGDDNIISTGFNDVPKFGGGIVWDDDARSELDLRDYLLKKDYAKLSQKSVFLEVFHGIKESGWLRGELSNKSDNEIVDHAFNNEEKILDGTRVSKLLEFSRVVHAEMNAITQAAREGRSTGGATLYCTTFPCHLCSRLIIAAGIKRVVYIEPYPKSLTPILYEGMINIDGDGSPIERSVQFKSFVGVAPSRYFRFFSMGERKQGDGTAYRDDRYEVRPRVDYRDESIRELENAAVATLDEGE